MKTKQYMKHTDSQSTGIDYLCDQMISYNKVFHYCEKEIVIHYCEIDWLC